jgi:hypothetical protein
MLKRTIVVLAVMAMVVALIPAVALAATTTVLVTVTGQEMDGVDLDIGLAATVVGTPVGTYNTTTKSQKWSFDVSAADDYNGDKTTSAGESADGQIAMISATNGTGAATDTTYYGSFVVSDLDDDGTAPATFAAPSSAGAVLDGKVVEDEQAKGATGDNVVSAGDTDIPGAAVEVYKGGVLFASTETDGTGDWMSILGSGTFTVMVDITGTVGPSLDTDVDCGEPTNPAPPCVGNPDEGEVQWLGGSPTTGSAVTLGADDLGGANVVYDNDIPGTDDATWDHIDVVKGAFSDTAGHWADKWIKLLATDGVVNGCTATAFCPEADITRAEFGVMLQRAMGTALGVVTTAPFSDVATTHWAASHIQALKASGVVVGSGGAFSPDAAISRAEAMAMLTRAALVMNWVGDVVDGSDTNSTCDVAELAAPTLSFIDVPTTFWAAREITWLFLNGVVSGNTNGTFAPNDNLSRAEMAKVLEIARTTAGSCT